MKTKKILLPLAALFFSAIAFGQRNNPNRSEKQHVKTAQTIDRRETARVNGSVNANEHANVREQQNANQNSVLNGTTTTTKTKHKVKYKKQDADKRKYGTKKKD